MQWLWWSAESPTPWACLILQVCVCRLFFWPTQVHTLLSALGVVYCSNYFTFDVQEVLLCTTEFKHPNRAYYICAQECTHIYHSWNAGKWFTSSGWCAILCSVVRLLYYLSIVVSACFPAEWVRPLMLLRKCKTDYLVQWQYRWTYAVLCDSHCVTCKIVKVTESVEDSYSIINCVLWKIVNCFFSCSFTGSSRSGRLWPFKTLVLPSNWCLSCLLLCHHTGVFWEREGEGTVVCSVSTCHSPADLACV